MTPEAQLQPLPEKSPTNARAVLVKDPEPKFELKVIPELAEPQHNQALVLAQKLDITQPRQVLNFGESVQSQVTSFSESLLENTSIADSGAVGKLLTQLREQVLKIKPEELTGPQKGLPWLWDRLFGPNSQSRIESVVSQHESIKPVIVKIGNDLGIEAEAVDIALDQLSEIEVQNRSYIQALTVVKAALSIRYNEALEDFKDRQRETVESGARDITKVSETRNQWEALQRIDRRLYALEASLALAHSSETQIDRLRDMLTYNLETIGEAQQIMLPAWRVKIGLAITALKARDQAEMMNGFRELTDQLLSGTADALTEIETLQTGMQKRTFASAEVIAKVNDALASSIESTLMKQLEAKAARDAGITLIKESQDRVVEAMKKSNQALLGATILDNPVSPKSDDLAAELLLTTPPSAKAANE